MSERKTDDFDLLEYLASHELKDAARHFNMTPSAIRGWLFRLRKKIVRDQDFLNRVRNLQKIYPRIRKLTTTSELAQVGKLANEDEDEKREDIEF